MVDAIVMLRQQQVNLIATGEADAHCEVSSGRDARCGEIFQRFLSLEPFEDEKCMEPECPQ
jgi:hypothetical protein